MIFRTSARLLIALAFPALLTAWPAIAQQPLRADSPAPLEVAWVSEPQLLAQGDKNVILYELILANPFSRPLRLRSLEIRSETEELLQALVGRSLQTAAQRLPRGNEGETAEDGLRLNPGERYLVYLWLERDRHLTPPTTLRHRFAVDLERNGSTLAWTQSGPELKVRRDAILIDPPVRGGTWRVGNGFAPRSNHRDFYVINGSLVIPQRFGSDFLKLDSEGRNAIGDGLRNEDHLAHQEPLYAVADGEVVSVWGGMPELAPGESQNTEFEWSDYPGNHVVQKLGPLHYAHYTHLKEGTLRVRKGQRLRRGDLIAQIGNSGNSTSPHLHFHMTQGPETHGSEGAPFLFRSFEQIDDDYRFRPDERPLPTAGRTMTASIPGNGWVIRFPSSAVSHGAPPDHQDRVEADLAESLENKFLKETTDAHP